MTRNTSRRNALKRFARASREAGAGSIGRGEESRLLAAARRGDTRALTRLLSRLSGPAYRFGRGFCRDRHDAEDVMQEVLAALAAGITRFRGEASLTSWAYVVARRVCMRRRRRRSGEPARIASLDAAPAEGGSGSALVDSLADERADPLDRLERDERIALLEQAISSLPAPLREVLLLRDVEGLSARVTGRTLRLGEPAVKSRLHRARAALRRSLAPLLAPETGAAPRGKHRPPSGPCPDTVGLISRFLEGELTAARCAELAAHVDGCHTCGSACDALRRALGTCRDYGRGPLPAEVRGTVRKAIRRVTHNEAAVARVGSRA